jgi:hypothetical protein
VTPILTKTRAKISLFLYRSWFDEDLLFQKVETKFCPFGWSLGNNGSDDALFNESSILLSLLTPMRGAIFGVK